MGILSPSAECSMNQLISMLMLSLWQPIPIIRRMGLGNAAVLDGIKRCGELGATVAYVGSDQKFYLSLGFNVIYTSECWVKYLE